jgi:hypothetical protein
MTSILVYLLLATTMGLAVEGSPAFAQIMPPALCGSDSTCTGDACPTGQVCVSNSPSGCHCQSPTTTTLATTTTTAPPATTTPTSTPVTTTTTTTPPTASIDQLKCQTGANKALGKFLGAKAKCITKCVATARETMGPYTGCAGPGFSDPSTNACIVKAMSKTTATIGKGCTADCPACYAANGNCPDGSAFVTSTETEVDALIRLVLCTELGTTPSTPNKDVAKCEDTVGKALGKFVAAKGGCFAKCIANARKGKVPQGSCLPPSPTDAATVVCVSKAKSSAAATIDKACATAMAIPSCHTATTGSDWVGSVETVVDGQLPDRFCAFLN